MGGGKDSLPSAVKKKSQHFSLWLGFITKLTHSFYLSRYIILTKKLRYSLYEKSLLVPLWYPSTIKMKRNGGNLLRNKIEISICCVGIIRYYLYLLQLLSIAILNTEDKNFIYSEFISNLNWRVIFLNHFIIIWTP